MNDHVKSNWTHYLTVAAAGVAWIAALNPAILTAIGVSSPVAAAVVASAAGAAGLLKAFGVIGTSSTSDTTATAPTSTSGSSSTKGFATILVILAISIAFSGCSFLKSASTSGSTTQTAIATAVTVATAAAIQNGSTDTTKWTARATQFESIAVKIKAVNDAGGATLATLAADLQPYIAKLGPADVIAANTLVAALTPQFNSLTQSNATIGEVQTTVDVVLSSVITACEAYGAPTP